MKGNLTPKGTKKKKHPSHETKQKWEKGSVPQPWLGAEHANTRCSSVKQTVLASFALNPVFSIKLSEKNAFKIEKVSIQR
uniref:Uncharacterized protein n=1 Tax=Anopheles atroparvus TaxID=41427 RepID=A0AAG5DUW8_ANOAO